MPVVCEKILYLNQPVVRMFPRSAATVLAVVILTGSYCTSDLVSSERSPNILLIMADDLGYEALGANGNKVEPAPGFHQPATPTQGTRTGQKGVRSCHVSLF